MTPKLQWALDQKQGINANTVASTMLRHQIISEILRILETILLNVQVWKSSFESMISDLGMLWKNVQTLNMYHIGQARLVWHTLLIEAPIVESFILCYARIDVLKTGSVCPNCVVMDWSLDLKCEVVWKYPFSAELSSCVWFSFCFVLFFKLSRYTRDMDVGSLLAHLDFYKIWQVWVFYFSIKTGEKALKICDLSFERY